MRLGDLHAAARAHRAVDLAAADDLQRVACACGVRLAAIASSGRVIVCGWPSSVTGIGVAWLPTHDAARLVDELREHVRVAVPVPV